jgi:hypothetical protein
MAARPQKLVRIAEQVDADSWIVDQTFEQALILGPAVILPAEKATFIRSGFVGPPETVFIEIPVGKQVQGVVGLRNVTFVDCVFQDCAIIGTADMIKQFRDALVPSLQTAAGAQVSSPEVAPQRS